MALLLEETLELEKLLLLDDSTLDALLEELDEDASELLLGVDPEDPELPPQAATSSDKTKTHRN